jgi:probable HAF family extracellular repeat protein
LHLERLEERRVPSNYQFTTLPDPPGSVFGTAGINDNGDIVGGYTDAARTTHAFLYSGGRYTTIDVPGSSFTTAYGINNEGQIVGCYMDTSHGFIDSGGSLFNLTGGYFTGINNITVPNSQGICETVSIPYPPQVGIANLVGGGEIIQVPNSIATRVWGINDDDLIVGDFVDASGTEHGFLWISNPNGGYGIDVLGFPSWQASSGNGINDAGQVVGGYTDASGAQHGFLLLPNSGYYTIDVPGSRFTRCAGINDAGQIVGVYADAGGVLHTFLATPGVDITVTSQWNELGRSNGVFGTFLTGVPLQNTFTVTLNDPQKQVSDVSFSLDGASGVQEQHDPNSNIWTYTTDMGQLSAGDHDLNITASSSSGDTLATFQGTVMAQDGVDLDVQATYPGGPANPQEINQFRFIDGVPITVNYTATITNLPLIDAYKDKLDLGFFSEPDEGSVIYANIPPLQAVSQDTATASFTLSTQNFHDLVPGIGFDYGVRVVPQASLGPANKLSDAQDFRVIQLPAWMGNPTVTYDANAGEYDIPINLGPDWTFPLPGTTGMDTAFDAFEGLFGNLDSSLSVGLSLVVTAKPTIGPNDVTLQPTDWHASATLLGYPVFDPQEGSFLDGNIHVLATLDPITLDAPTSIRIINDPLIILGITLFERDYSAQLPGILPLGGILNLEADLTGSLQAQLTYLTAQASVQLDIAPDGSLSLDGQNTWLLITGSASATATLGVNLGVGVNLLDVIGINQAGYTGLTCNGSLTAQLTTTLMVNFSGPLTGPAITLNQQASSAQMTIGYDVNINFYLLGGNLFSSEFTPDAPLIITLFGLDGGGAPPPGGGSAAPPGQPPLGEPGQPPLFVTVNLGYADPVMSLPMPAEVHPVQQSMQPNRAGIVDRCFASLNEPAEWSMLPRRTRVGSPNELLYEILDAVL